MSSQSSASGGYNSQQQSLRTRYNNATGTGYRGVPASGLVAPYAFTSTPQLSSPLAQRPVQQAHGVRSASSNSRVSQYQSISPTYTPTLSPAPVSYPSSPAAQKANAGNWPSLTLNLPPSESLMPLSPSIASPPAKPSPDRYRKNVQRGASGESVSPSITPPGTAAGQIYAHPTQSNSSPSLASHQSYRGATYNAPLQSTKASADDAVVGRSSNPDLASRYRRRSLGALETAGLVHGDVKDAASPHSNILVHSNSSQTSLNKPHQPVHYHTGSSESVTSSRSGHSSRPTSAARNEVVAAKPVSVTPLVTQPQSKAEPRLLAPQNRTPEPTKRTPSPLSKPANLQPERTDDKQSTARPTSPGGLSTAAEHLTALNLKNPGKPKSKIRRAFSFGSAAELRKATAQNNMEKSLAATTVNKRTSKHEEELDPEQARIAARQEAAGLGESIYSGQGNFFTGSTDNLSVSSTASSASIMLRKMGKGMKKGTRSLVGLFRPKSVIGVPAADGPINAASEAQVSMVTVEAERDRVNVNLNPHDQVGGGTGFPRLERNSIDAKNHSLDSNTLSSDSKSRRSVVGSDRERAEILTSVKKGILKRHDLLVPSPRLDAHGGDLGMPHIPHINDTPRSSAPSTPTDEPPRSGHRRTDSVAIEGADHDDYFTTVTRYVSVDSKNSPMTPRGLNRNISFSPRIQFHDTWPSGEYDRRGDIATCNRLTPMLAQQIKEELNTFKMEMEVHESSKVYTHFF